MKHIVVVCDNTMGIPGKEIDDGLALLYLLGMDDVVIDAICVTHANASTEETYDATQRLMAEFGVDIPVLRGADAPSERMGWLPSDYPTDLKGQTSSQEPSEAAQYIAARVQNGEDVSLLSLGAATDLAAAERLSPGCLARYSEIALMGGITHSLFVGGLLMNELNFSVDGQAACDTFSTARDGARLLLADAWNCLPVTFWSKEFEERLIKPEYKLSGVLKTYCMPWMKFALSDWNTDGFVGWDVLAAVALVRPDLVELEPFEVACNPRLFSVGYLERAQAPEIAAPISLVVPRNGEALCEHIYQSWERAVQA